MIQLCFLLLQFPHNLKSLRCRLTDALQDKTWKHVHVKVLYSVCWSFRYLPHCASSNYHFSYCTSLLLLKHLYRITTGRAEQNKAFICLEQVINMFLLICFLPAVLTVILIIILQNSYWVYNLSFVTNIKRSFFSKLNLHTMIIFDRFVKSYKKFGGPLER